MDHFAQVAFHHAVEIIQRQPDPMIGDAVLRKVVGANFFFATAGADLRFSMRGIFGFFLALLFLEEPRAHDAQRFFLVLLLTATVLTTHNAAGRDVKNLDCGIGRVHALAPRTTRAANFNPQILRLYFKIYFLGFSSASGTTATVAVEV